MAATISIVCPECKRQAKAPDSVLGKRVRCKFCQASFVARSGGGPAGKQGKPAAKPAKPTKPARPADDDEEDENPYGVTNLDLTLRCPNCANEMEDEDAIVCLHCGYNTRTRELAKTKKIYDTTAGDQFSWLLPGILCVLAIIAALVFDIWYLMKIDDLVDRENDSWYLAVWASGGIKLWVVIMSLFVIFFCGRFAIKRLLIHNSPPEVEKLK